MDLKIDTTYADLMSAMVPPGMYPEEMIMLVADQVMDLIPLEQAAFMLDTIRRFDARFGPGAYLKMNMAMTGSIQKAMAELPPAEMLRMSLEMMRMQGLELPKFGGPSL